MAKTGRPSSYKPEYCEAVVDCMKRGFSLTAFAGEIGVARSTVHEWMAAHPEFSDAVKRGQAARVRFLEERLLNGDTGPRVTSHIFALKNADPEEWRDKQSHEHTGKDGGPIQYQDMSDVERAQRLAHLMAQRGE